MKAASALANKTRLSSPNDKHNDGVKNPVTAKGDFHHSRAPQEVRKCDMG